MQQRSIILTFNEGSHRPNRRIKVSHDRRNWPANIAEALTDDERQDYLGALDSTGTTWID